MPKVFISHSWEDNELSRKIAQYLKEDGAEIWIDYARIKPGEGMPDRIGEALEWCDTLVLVWSKNAGSSYYVKLEWQSALDMQKKIIPCIMDDTKRPPILRGFLYIDFKNFEQGYAQLLYALNLKRSKKTTPPIVPPPKIDNESAAEKPKPEKIQPKPVQKTEPPPQSFVDIQQDVPGRKKNQLKQLFLPLLAVLLVAIGIYALSNSDGDNREANITSMDESVTVDSTAIIEPERVDSEKVINGIEFVLINGGTFVMGDNIGDGVDDEKPVHSVKISSFYISKTEVTNAQFCEFLNEKGNQTEGGVTWLEIESEYCKITKESGRYIPTHEFENHPVVEVSWYGALAYSQWAGGQLPTEAQWEYAARGGNKSNGYTYSGSNSIEAVAWYTEKSGSKTHPVGTKQPNELGIYDMSGNVWEWCQDKWHDNYQGAPTDGSAWKTGNSSFRVYRGGSWNRSAQYCRSADRNSGYPEYRYGLIGFRLVFVP